MGNLHSLLSDLRGALEGLSPPRQAPGRNGARAQREATPAEGDGLTPRQRELLARRLSPLTLAALYAERPRGACVVCWRDLPAGTRLLAQVFVCDRPARFLRRPCRLYLRRCQRATESATQRAKGSFLREVARG